jgi:N utilization substance protein B
MTDSKIKVLIVDDSALMRRVLGDILSSDSRIRVVGTARDGVDCLAKIAQFSPDVITLDVEMPNKDGLATLEEIMKTNRKKSREVLMQVLYQSLIKKEDPMDTLTYLKELIENDDDYKDIENLDYEYIENTIKNYTLHLSDIDKDIENNLVNWKIDRISKVDLSILRLSLCEIKYDSSIPNVVSVNEAVELSKTFCDDKSRKYINGILTKFI